MCAVAVLAGCSAEGGGPTQSVASPVTVTSKACTAPESVLGGPSPFEAALASYADEGATAAALASLAGACRGSLDHDAEAAACLLLAVLHQAGEGMVQDAARAAEYRDRASQNDGSSIDLGAEREIEMFRDQAIQIRIDSITCRLIGRACPAGCEASCEAAVVRLRERTIDAMMRACDRGRGAACHLAAHVVQWGLTIDYVGQVPPSGDAARATTLSERACSLGVGEACVVLARRAAEHSRELMRAGETIAAASARAEVERGFARACVLGIPRGCLEQGDRARAAQDLPAAEAAYGRACELGMKLSCRDLSRMYEKGAFPSIGDESTAPAPWPRDEAKSARYRALAGTSDR